MKGFLTKTPLYPFDFFGILMAEDDFIIWQNLDGIMGF
jgi:hypothetical protein